MVATQKLNTREPVQCGVHFSDARWPSLVLVKRMSRLTQTLGPTAFFLNRTAWSTVNSASICGAQPLLGLKLHDALGGAWRPR